MIALMLTLPATLIGLVALLVITSGLERTLARPLVRLHPARVVPSRRARN